MSAEIVLRYQCPRCQVPNQAVGVHSGTCLSCTACDWSREVHDDDLTGNGPRRCLVCHNDDLWRQKNFPQALGLTVVGAGAFLFLVACYYYRPVLAMSVLLGVAAIDFGLFVVMPDVLVCYRCGARHSGGDIGEHPVFDHETAERYRQEKLRLGETVTSATEDVREDTSRTPQ